MRTRPDSLRLRDVLANRREFARLLLSAAVLSLGVNLAAMGTDAAISGLWPSGSRPWYASPGFLGVLLIVIAAGVLLGLAYGRRTLLARLEPVVVVSREASEILPVPLYRFANELHRTLAAVFVENEALRRTWTKHPLVAKRKMKPVKGKGGPMPKKLSGAPSYTAVIRMTKEEADKPASRSAALLREAAEFVVIDTLSTHLSTYFGDDDAPTKLVKEYQRDDVPALLLENRCLALLCAPLEDRLPFADIRPKGAKGGEVFTVYASSGAVYSRFDLNLPVGTSISRPEADTLEIKCPRMTLRITTRYRGMSTTLPPPFLQHYVGIPFEEASVQKLDVVVEATIPAWSLLLPHGWQYYRWIDSFLEELRERFDVDAFLERISWRSLEAQLVLAGTHRRARSRRGDEKNETPEQLVAAKPATAEGSSPLESEQAESEQLETESTE